MRRGRKPFAAILAICLVVTALAVTVEFLGWVEGLEMKTVDARFRARHWLKSRWGATRVSLEVVLAGVDQKSVDPASSPHADRWGSGGWLTRDHWISAMRQLATAWKPNVVGLDFMFLPYRTRADGTDAELERLVRGGRAPLRDALQEERFPRVGLLNLLDEVCNARFANLFYTLDEARRRDPSIPQFIVACALTREAEDASPAWRASEAADRERAETLEACALPASCVVGAPPDYPFADNATLPFDLLASAPVELGAINVPRDPDGNLRRLPLIVGFRTPKGETRFAPSFALRACLLHLGADPRDATGRTGLRVEFGREVRLWNAERTIRVPVDRLGRLFLNFEGKIADFPQVPWVALADYGPFLGEGPSREAVEARRIRERLRGNIVLVGETFTGAGDIGPCALDSNAPYVFIHMTAVDNILRASFLRPPGRAASSALVAGLLVVLALLNARAGVLVSGVGTAFLLVGAEAAAFGLFLANAACLPMVLPGGAIVVAFGAVSLYRYRAEQKARIEIRRKFGAMVSDVVLHYLEEHPESFSLAGERREATVFFSDVAGFTSLSERMAPERLVEILNAYLGPMSDIIKAHRGCVNKFAGDGIMAFWGAPYPSDDHAWQACLAALEQQARIRELAAHFREAHGVELVVRMGIHTGLVSAGGMGSADRREYTVMGDTVNFAARLEPANKDYGTRIMIGEVTNTAVKGVLVTRRLDRLVVAGKRVPVEVFELVGRKEDVGATMREAISRFEKGLELYWRRDWVGALAEFGEALRLAPGDPPSLAFIARARAFQADPPPPDWQGEYVRTKKS
ncbi:MAG: adenylate/guanylate cyclase domain-containing protein [Verrucomicrobiae bacterium]|nr:adenylate/guanylate cyclase domain-containing protein [Verrucomicrobiae bacterium]